MSQTRDQQAIERLRSSGGGGGGAPTNASYLVLGYNATLTDERLFTDGHGIDSTDAGAGSTFTVAVDETELSHALLGNRAWTSSGHTGTINTIAGFNGSGAADEYEIGVDLQAYDAQLAAIAGTTPTAGSIHYWTSATGVAVLGPGTPGQVLAVSGSNVPAWVSSAYSTVTQSVSSDTTMTTDADHVHVTASCTLTLPAISSSTIGHATVITTVASTRITVILAANASDKIEGAAKLAIYSSRGVAVIIPVAANRWVVSTIRGIFTWQHCGVDLTAASGSSPWTLTTTNGDSTTWTDISSASNSVAASSGLELTSAVGTAYYNSSTGAVVKTPISGLKDAWGRALRSDESFWLLYKQSRTTGSGTNPQPGISLATSTISGTPKLGVVQTGGGGGVLQLIYRLTSTVTLSLTETYLTSAHWLGGWYSADVRGFRGAFLNVATTGEPGDEWWPTAYPTATNYRWGQDFHGQMLDPALLTDIHLSQVGATDKFTATYLAILQCRIGTEGE